MRVIITTVLVLMLAGSLAGGLFLTGFLSPAANEQHSGAVYRAIDFIVDTGVAWSASGIETPELDDPQRIERGVALYRSTCVQCHGAPGTAPATFALGMTPVPPSIMQVARDRPANEIFWVAKNGIRTTGMPSWDLKLSDEALWDIVAAVKELQRLSPMEYYELAGIEPPEEGAPLESNGDTVQGNRERGRIAIQQFGCTSCHKVEGVVGADVWVGPPLEDLHEQQFIAGVLLNNPRNLVRWIMSPQEVDPLTAMPNVGVDRESAEDIAAYLASPSR